MIRLIASDIDGTLVPEGTGAINPEYFEIIKKLKDRGIRFAAVSGRNYNSVAKLFAPVLDDIYLILENGGWILEGSRTLFTRTFQRETVCGITAAAEKMDNISAFIAHTMEGIYVWSKDPSIVRMMEEGYHNVCFPVKSREDMKNVPLDIFEMSVYVDGDPARAHVPLAEGVAPDVSQAVAGAHWIDMMPAEVNKGDGLRKLCGHMEIEPEDTLAFGDNKNDIPLLLAAGEAWCVEEAAEEVKKTAGRIVGSLSDDAVLKHIKQYL